MTDPVVYYGLARGTYGDNVGVGVGQVIDYVFKGF